MSKSTDSITINYPRECDQEGAHAKAAKALCAKLADESWRKPFVSLPRSFVHVFAN